MSRVLVISDIHGNLYSLESILNAVSRWDNVIVLGDLVDYGPMPGEVIDKVKSLGAKVVRGNHDHAVAYGVDCRCGEETHWLSVWFRENITNKLLGKEDKEWLGRLPLRLELDIDGLNISVVHGAPSNPLYAYLYPWASEEELCASLRRTARLRRSRKECPKGFYAVGHTHYQFYRVTGGSIVLNPGSAGQPRDGDWRVAYAVIDSDNGRVELGRVKYNVEKTIMRLQEFGIPDPYSSALKVMFREGRVPTRQRY